MRQREAREPAVKCQDGEKANGERDSPYCASSGIGRGQSGTSAEGEQTKPKFQILIKNQDELDKMAESFLHYAGPFINKGFQGANSFSPYLVKKLLKTLKEYVSIFELKFVTPPEWDVRFAEGTIVVPVQVYFSEGIEELLLSIANDRDGDQSKEL